MTDAIDFDEAVIELAREHFYLGERGPGRTLQAAAALHVLRLLHLLHYHTHSFSCAPIEIHRPLPYTHTTLTAASRCRLTRAPSCATHPEYASSTDFPSRGATQPAAPLPHPTKLCTARLSFVWLAYHPRWPVC